MGLPSPLKQNIFLLKKILTSLKPIFDFTVSFEEDVKSTSVPVVKEAILYCEREMAVALVISKLVIELMKK